MGRNAVPVQIWVAGAALFAALVTSSEALALSPEPLPSGFWWRAGGAVPLDQDPLAMLREPGRASLRSEWAPLYRQPDGARFERARRAWRVTSAAPAAAFAAEFEEGISVARGGSGAWWVGADQGLSRRAIVAAGRSLGRLDAALAGGVDADGDPAGGIGVAARPLPGFRIAGNWSNRPERGELEVRWDDTHVRAPGRWREQAVKLALAGATSRSEAGVSFESLDRKPAAGRGWDSIEPALAWRSVAFHAAASRAGRALRLEFEHGEGRQRFRLRREGAYYGSLAGPITSDLATLTARRGALAARSWAGRWSGEAMGTIALWPFAELTAVLGSRRYAVSEASLDHWGVAIDRAAPRSAWEAGLAAWSLRPRAAYQSWQGTVLGLGRDDPSSGETTLHSALLAGVRLAGKAQWGGLATRLELVQWVPVHSTRDRRPAGEVDGDGGSNGAEGPAIARGRGVSGGTIVRLEVTVAR